MLHLQLVMCSNRVALALPASANVVGGEKYGCFKSFVLADKE